MVSKTRAQRIADRIREELSQVLIQEVADPRLGGISVTSVEVDRELAFAKVFVSSLEGSERAPEILEGLRSAHGFLRSALSQRIELRTFPRLRFEYDAIFEEADKIERLFAQLAEEKTAQQGEPGEEAADLDDEDLDEESLEDEGLEDEGLEDEGLEDESLEDESLEDEDFEDEDDDFEDDEDVEDDDLEDDDFKDEDEDDDEDEQDE